MAFSTHCLRIAGLLAGLALSACATTQASAPPQSQAAATADVRSLLNPRPPFAVNLTAPDRQPLLQGDPAVFRIDSQRAGFAQLYLLRASGTALMLAENLPVRIHEARAFPSAADGFDLRAQPPSGVGTAVLVVTTRPFAPGLGPAERPTQPQSITSPLGRDAFVERLGGALRQLHPEEWSGALASVEVLARK